MQTFLPSTSFQQSAKWLDNARLGKQRVECLQILNALVDSEYGWQNHPAVKMWRGHELALGRYGLAICNEWVNRGYKDSCYRKIVDLFNGIIPYQSSPSWLTEEFASNHRSILLSKVQASYIAACNIEAGLRWRKDIFNNVPESELLKSKRRVIKCYKTQEWYRSFGWAEQPAQKVLKDSRLVWPYL